MEITKVYTQKLPEFCFIGKLYHDEDRVDGLYAAKWEEAFADGLFERIEAGIQQPLCEDGDAYIGLCHDGANPFYGIGMFAVRGTPIPEGCTCIDLPAAEFGICWLSGKEYELYGNEELAAKALVQAGHIPVSCADGNFYCFERYACPRFTTPDENGNVVLDIGFCIG